jgi:hypothetical protein
MSDSVSHFNHHKHEQTNICKLENVIYYKGHALEFSMKPGLLDGHENVAVPTHELTSCHSCYNCLNWRNTTKFHIFSYIDLQ